MGKLKGYGELKNQDIVNNARSDEWDSKELQSGSLTMRKYSNSGKRSKRRSVTSDGVFNDNIGPRQKGMSQSEQYPSRQDEDEDLLFNMSMIE